MTDSRFQRTISQVAAVSGFGYWSGLDVTVEFAPASAGAGITFVRTDLGPKARVAARAEFRRNAPRRTNLQNGEVRVEMVEHVLAALSGLQIDNCEVRVNQAEMPGCDGSSLPFVEALLAAGIVEQSEAAKRLIVAESTRIVDGESWVAAHPAIDGRLSIEFELEFPHNAAIGRQTAAAVVTPETFRRELAPCRTFVLACEAEAMVRQGFGRRATPRDLLVFDEHGPVDNRLRFENECARHKALDVLGDLALTGYEVVARIVACRSNHRLNAALAFELIRRFAESPVPLQGAA